MKKIALEVEKSMMDALADKHGPFVLPSDHIPAIRVPKGGSCCANCKYGSIVDGKGQCGNEYFIQWNGSPELPLPADEYCSDWFEPKNVSKS